jgi:EAL domain-containing protein (putative c-di-GMP-specific phosphodiesterase class I)
MKVVAEGIERAEQMAMLKDLGCELGQGYLFSKPADATAMEQFIASHKSGNVRRGKAKAAGFSA